MSFENGVNNSFSEKTPLLGPIPKSDRQRVVRHGVQSVGSVYFWLLVVGIFVLGLGRYLVLLAFFPDVPHFHKPTTTCMSAACVHASSEILYNLSPNYKELDPCENFEELVCGGWRERHDLRPDQGDAFTGTTMSENSQTLLRHILEAPYPKDSQHSYFSPAMLSLSVGSVDKQNFDMLKAAYDACLDEETIKSAGSAPLEHILAHVSDLSGSIPDTIRYLADLGVGALVATGTGADDRDPDTVVVMTSSPGRIGLPAKELYEDESILKKYQEVITQVFARLFPDHLINEAPFYMAHYASGVAEFEKRLAAASPPSEDFGDITKTYNPMSLKDASDLAPQVDLSGLIDHLSPGESKPDRIIVIAPNYLKELKTIIDETPGGTLWSYFVWKAIQAFHAYVEADAITPYRRFLNEISGKEPDSKPERWRACVSYVDEGLGWILSRFFVEKAFSASAKEFGDEIVTDIKTEFIKKLKATEWMEPSVIDLAIDKVHNIVQKIGYPTESPNIMDPPSLQAYYSSLRINSSDYFQNAVEMNKFALEHEWSSLGKPVDRAKWEMSVPTVNAYYNPPGNEIVFPAGIMQFPVFDVNVPQYMSYGAFGAVSGHELSHAFDSTGRHYDQNGNYTDWWTNKTVAGFEKCADCFVDQYSKYTVEGLDGKPLHVNGRLTLGENIADAGGLSASFQAWKIREKKTPNPNLPGLEFFTQEQLFFVSYSNWWCGKSKKEAAVNRIYTDPHAPKWARILGTMANSREFRESFKCKEKKPTCELW